jgi:hypothetical protein
LYSPDTHFIQIIILIIIIIIIISIVVLYFLNTMQIFSQIELFYILLLFMEICLVYGKMGKISFSFQNIFLILCNNFFLWIDLKREYKFLNALSEKCTEKNGLLCHPIVPNGHRLTEQSKQKFYKNTLKSHPWLKCTHQY